MGTEKWIHDEGARYLYPQCGQKLFRVQTDVAVVEQREGTNFLHQTDEYCPFETSIIDQRIFRFSITYAWHSL